ncbi:hypothetical protein FACS1894139_11640 [Planctomycetales bacterium]|nr:hypothetical protein FACS1894108_05230 [Planctomycetales bacterium]GHT06255.1 hypothetical protein FACS1894139_11640 [Planctomycetales bacterium]GHV23485.1 hypothetical protein AGMMS49959_16670 [Planctomycetales bacterium]
MKKDILAPANLSATASILEIKPHKQFRQDVKRLGKQNKNLDELNAVITLLQKQKILPEKYRDHPLKGNFAGFRGCHLSGDWILAYRVNRKNNRLELYGTGTHREVLNIE